MPLISFSAAIEEDNELWAHAMSAAEVRIGGKLEDAVDAIISIMNKGAMYLGR